MVRDTGAISERRALYNSHTTAGRREQSVFRAITLTLAAGVIALGVAIGVTTWRFEIHARSDAREQAADSAALAARTALSPFITAGVLSEDPMAWQALEAAVAELVEHSGALRFKFWDRDGTIVWSDDPRLIGQQFELDDAEIELFDSLGSIAEFSALDRAENQLDTDLPGEVIEVYLATQLPGLPPILVESYFDGAIADEIAAHRREHTLPLLIGGMVLLFLIYVPLAVVLLWRSDRHRRERTRLLEQAMTISDAERRRIAGEVHDGVVQQLIASAYSLSVAAERAPAELKSTLGSQASAARRMIRELRSLLTSIYPADLPDGGWIAGLNDAVTSLYHRGVEVEFDLDVRRLTRAQEELVLRVAREALRNVATHAAATRVIVELRQNATGHLSLRISDDGRGFDDDEARRQRHDGHLGLQLLADLAVEAGGSLRIGSSPGEGTVLELELAGSR